MSLLSRYFLIGLLMTVSSLVFGQAARSPFSTFGLGDPYGNALGNNQGMGGIGVSQPQFWFINNQNPALLVFNFYTAFQAGMVLESKSIKGDTTSIKSAGGNLNYLVTALPIKPGKWTTSVGLMPFTSKNYRIEYNDVVENAPTDTVTIVEQGSGGLSQLYWSNGVRVHDNWSIGVKASYLFGSVENDYTNTLITVAQPVRYTIAVKEQVYSKGFQFTGALSFSKDSIGKKDDYRVSAGLTYAWGTDLRASSTTVFQRRFIVATPISSDTIYSNRGRVTIPSALTLGISVSRSTNWTTGVELAMQDWSEYRPLNEDQTQSLGKAWKLSGGGEFTPDFLSDKLFKRMTFRAGFSYEKAPFLINSNELRDFGINFGFSVPTGRSSLDFAFITGKRGDRSKNVLEESYFRLYFGITFNDQWFIRRRFD